MSGWVALFACILQVPAAAPRATQDDSKDERVLIGSVPFTTPEVEAILELSPLPSVPPDATNAVYESEAAARFGQALFFDTRLSANGEVSCATCHVPAKDWTDGLRVGVGQRAVSRNTMSLWNVAYNRWYFWDGRRDTLWAQALTPLEDPREHDFSRVGLVHVLANDADYRRAYGDVFGKLPDVSALPAAARPGDPTKDPRAVAWDALDADAQDTVNRVFSNAGKALAAFQRELVSTDSPFDQYARGLRDAKPYEQRAITESAKRGLRLFVGKARCVLCHSGPTFSDLEFHDTRVDGPDVDGGPDIGRFQGIKDVQADPFNGVGAYSDDPTGEADAKVSYLFTDGHAVREFKTPTLRNVAMTAPYMHHGRFETLAEVVEFYSTMDGAADRDVRERLLVPVGLTGREIADLLDFLESLSGGGIDPQWMRAPEKPYLDQ